MLANFYGSDFGQLGVTKYFYYDDSNDGNGEPVGVEHGVGDGSHGRDDEGFRRHKKIRAQSVFRSRTKPKLEENQKQIIIFVRYVYYW